MCRDQFGARDSWLNNWEHRGEDMYCPRALLKLPRSGRDFFFFFCVKDSPAPVNEDTHTLDGKTALRKVRVIPGGLDHKATVAAVMIVVVAIFGVELADIAQRNVSCMEAAIMTAISGPNRPCRAKGLVFMLLMRGRVAPSMIVPYKRMWWLAQLART